MTGQLFIHRQIQDASGHASFGFPGHVRRDNLDLGEVTFLEHSIDTGTSQPVKQRFRRTPLGFAGEEEAHLNMRLRPGVIQPSVSEWASPPGLIRKRDFRAVNACCSKDVFPLPLIDYWYSKSDPNSAYWQVKIKEKSSGSGHQSSQRPQLSRDLGKLFAADTPYRWEGLKADSHQKEPRWSVKKRDLEKPRKGCKTRGSAP